MREEDEGWGEGVGWDQAQCRHPGPLRKHLCQPVQADWTHINGLEKTEAKTDTKMVQ